MLGRSGAAASPVDPLATESSAAESSAADHHAAQSSPAESSAAESSPAESSAAESRTDHRAAESSPVKSRAADHHAAESSAADHRAAQVITAAPASRTTIARANARYGVTTPITSPSTLATSSIALSGGGPAVAAHAQPATALPVPSTPPVPSTAPAPSTPPAPSADSAMPPDDDAAPVATPESAGPDAEPEPNPGPAPGRVSEPGTGRRWPGPVRRERPSAKLSPFLAIPLLVVLVAAGIVLVNVSLRLINRGIAQATGAVAAANPLIVPAPPVAGGLPRRYLPEVNPATVALINEFTQRFTAVSGPYHGTPAALYREPGTVDPVSDQPGWIEYLGYNATKPLGSPTATIDKLIASLIQTTAPNTSWHVKPGIRGGSARCAIARYRGTTVSICAWATERSFGALLSPNSDTRGNELATLMPQMRLYLQPG